MLHQIRRALAALLVAAPLGAQARELAPPLRPYVTINEPVVALTSLPHRSHGIEQSSSAAESRGFSLAQTSSRKRGHARARLGPLGLHGVSTAPERSGAAFGEALGGAIDDHGSDVGNRAVGARISGSRRGV